MPLIENSPHTQPEYGFGLGDAVCAYLAARAEEFTRIDPHRRLVLEQMAHSLARCRTASQCRGSMRSRVLRWATNAPSRQHR